MFAEHHKRLAITNILSLVLGLLVPLFMADQAQAGVFNQAYIRLDRMKSSTTTGGLVCANPSTSGTENDVQVTFPTGFTVNGTAGNWTVTTSNLPSGASAWTGIGTATAVSSQTVTFPSGDLSTGTLYCFNFASSSTLTTHATPDDDYNGTITTRTSGPATIDSTSYATSVVSDDQIVVSATVPAIFSFSLSGNTDSFSGDLSSTSTTSTSGRTVTIGTNAQDGWIAWVKSLNAGLTSATASSTINTAGSVDNSPTDLASNTGYVLDVNVTTDGSGTGTVTQASNYGAEYNGTNSTSGGTLSTNFQSIAASDGTTDGDVLTLIERAKVSALQAAAGDYTDTLTVVAAGRF